MSGRSDSPWTRFLVAPAIVLLTVAFSGCATETPRPTPLESWEVAVESEFPRPEKPDGLSGVTRLPDGRFAAIDDSGGNLWFLTVATDDDTGELCDLEIEGKVHLDGVVDGEGCAYDPLRDTIWVSDEKGPRITEHDLKSGRRLGSLALTPDLMRRRVNRGPEALTISPDGLTLWTCAEEAVEGDGPLASPTNGSPVRLHRYVRSRRADAWRHAGEVPYEIDPMGGEPYGKSSRSGVSGLCALGDGTLFVLEREMSVKGLFPTFRLRLYEVRAGAAKRLVVERETGFAMYEGVCLVEESPRAVRLLFVSDGDGAAEESVLSMTLRKKEN